MYRTLLLFFLLLHIVSDYYLQTEAMADEKKTSRAALLKHSALYAAVFVALTAAVWSGPVIAAAALLAVVHFLVDCAKYACLRKLPAEKHTDSSEARAYCVDQGLHLAFIAAAAAALKLLAIPASVWPYWQTAFALVPAEPLRLLRWLCLVAFLWKPANVTVKMLTAGYKPAKNAQDSSKDKAGAFIGFLERMIILLLLSVGQYAAIGLVLTAKSVARYKRISEDQSFAEYYLLGTLLSTLLAIAAYFLLILLI